VKENATVGPVHYIVKERFAFWKPLKLVLLSILVMKWSDALMVKGMSGVLLMMARFSA
jgi:hypothetical protein